MARKTLDDLDTLLAQPWSGPVSHSERQKGAAYLAIDDLMDEARSIFGVTGYTWQVLSLTHDGDFYIALGQLTIFPSDAAPIVIARTGISKARGDGERLMKMATGSAASAALKSCLAQFPHFRLDDEERGAEDDADQEEQPRKKYSGGSKSNGLGPRPSDKQLFHLKKAGYTDDDIDELEFSDWKARLDAYFNDKLGKKAYDKAHDAKAAPKKAAKVEADEDEEEDGDDDLDTIVPQRKARR